jgi:CHAT domain-containing protein
MADDPLATARAARRALDEVIEQIRAVDGYQDFLRPPTFDDVARSAGGQPVVYITAAEPGGLAFVVDAGEVTPVELPALTADAVNERVTRFLDVYARFGAAVAAHPAGHPSRVQARDTWSRHVDEIAGWMWTNAVGPVWERIGQGDHSTRGRGVALVSGGLLGLLPMHAAWVQDGGADTARRYAIDLTTISQVPNARSLAAARAVAADTPGTRLLAVADPQPQRHPAPPPLPRADVEVAAAAAAFAAPTTLVGPAATAEAVRRALVPPSPGARAATADGADVLHFACHGSALLDRPLDSFLLLADGQRLRLRDLLGMRLRARLAVLSACETSRPGTDLPDEVVALPTGLLQAGVAGVVAPLWAVSDTTATMIVVEFYRSWRWDDMAPPDALRRAQRWVRDTTNEQKLDAWERALTAGAGWLPRPVADALLDVVALRDPAARDESEIVEWGAFTYVGV